MGDTAYKVRKEDQFIVRWRPNQCYKWDSWVSFQYLCGESPEMFLNMVLFRNVPQDPGSHFFVCLKPKKMNNCQCLLYPPMILSKCKSHCKSLGIVVSNAILTCHYNVNFVRWCYNLGSNIWNKVWNHCFGIYFDHTVNKTNRTIYWWGNSSRTAECRK